MSRSGLGLRRVLPGQVHHVPGVVVQHRKLVSLVLNDGRIALRKLVAVRLECCHLRQNRPTRVRRQDRKTAERLRESQLRPRSFRPSPSHDYPAAPRGVPHYVWQSFQPPISTRYQSSHSRQSSPQVPSRYRGPRRPEHPSSSSTSTVFHATTTTASDNGEQASVDQTDECFVAATSEAEKAGLV